MKIEAAIKAFKAGVADEEPAWLLLWKVFKENPSLLKS